MEEKLLAVKRAGVVTTTVLAFFVTGAVAVGVNIVGGHIAQGGPGALMRGDEIVVPHQSLSQTGWSETKVSEAVQMDEPHGGVAHG